MAMRDSFEELRPVLVGLVEAVGQSAWSEELRQELAVHYKKSREQVASMVRASLGDAAAGTGTDPEVVASFLIAVCDGLVLQWLVDPDGTPSGETLISSLGSALAQALERGVGPVPTEPRVGPSRKASPPTAHRIQLTTGDWWPPLHRAQQLSDDWRKMGRADWIAARRAPGYWASQHSPFPPDKPCCACRLR